MKRKIKRGMKRRLFNSTLAVALALTTVPLNIFPHTAKAEGTGSTATLRILETTDLHSNVMPYDYFKDAPVTNYGLAKTATLIQQARSEKANSMLFDAGDTIQGNPLASYVAKVNKLGPNDTHPIYKAMNHLEYDAGIVGNHEFNYGLDYLKDVMQEVKFPIVNANIYKDDHDSNPDNDVNYFTPYQILDKKIIDDQGKESTIKVGVIGFAPPQIMRWDKDNLAGNVITKDIKKQAEKFIPEMKAKGADVIVAIAHSGCDIAEAGQEEAENAVYDLTKVPGIDAMLFGHAHLNFPGDASFNTKAGIDNTKGTINGVQAVEAGFWGNNLGVLDLALVQDASGKWTVDKTNSKSVNRPVDANTALDQTIVKDVQKVHDETINYVRGKIGDTEIPMHSFFTRVMDDASTQIVNAAQMDYVNKWIKANAPEYKDIPVLSAAAPFKGGRGGVSDYTNIEKGPVAIKGAADLYLFDNTLKAVEVTGDQVKRWLEISASQFNTIDPNKAGNQDLLDYDFRPYNYDVIDGVKYQIDVTKPVGQRIVKLTMLDGKAVDPAQKFIVATNNYRAGGSGGLPELKDAKVVVDSPFENRQILMDYISAQGTINPVADNNWKIAPVGGVAKVVFNSAPEAKPYLGQTPNVKDLGASTTKPGYELFELDQNVHVQLLGINDLHGQLDYKTTVNGQSVGGIEYLAGYLKEREATNPSNTLMVQAGDAVGASRPVSALLQDEPTIRFLNELGFDVGTIGNHEFDEGVAEMKRLIYGGAHPSTEKDFGAFEGASFPYVVANVEDENTGKLILPPYVVKEVDGVKIGFIGVVTTETPTIVTPSGVAGVKFTDEATAINKYAAELKSQGIKSIVVLAHNAGTSSTDGTNAKGSVVDIAKKVDKEVDVIYGAHDHAYLNADVDGKLLVQSYSYGTAFSDIDLTIDPITQDVVTKKGEIVRTFQNKEHLDAKIKAEIDKYQAYIAPIVSVVVGDAANVITKKVNASGENAMGNLIADSMRVQTGAQFGFMNAGGVRDEIKKAGPITWGDLFAVQPFGNDVVTEKITGAQVRILLNQQWSETSYAKIMLISGLTYTWSDKLSIGNKILDIYLPDGSKIDPKAVYTVAVNNFMADGGDGFTILKEGKDRVTQKTDLDTLIDYVKAQKGPISSKIEGRIKLVDVTPPAPHVAEVTDQSTKVTGNTVAGAQVEVKANGTVIGSETASANGNFSVAIPVQKAGTDLVVIATDSAMNVSYDKKVKVTDVTAPSAPSVDEVTDQSTKVTGKAEAGSLVEVKANGTVIGSTTASEDGSYTVVIPVQPALTELIVTATDAAQNVSKETIVKVIDVTDPNAPSLDPVTNKDVKITGHAEKGTKVVISDGKDLKITLFADDEGNFTAQLLQPFKEGTVLYVFSIDAAMNVSPINMTTVLDVIAPNAPSVNKVGDSDKKVTGKAEAGSTVTVLAGKTVLGSATTDNNGNFSVALNSAQKAGTALTVTVADKAGNASPAVKTTVIDNTAPVKPVVSQVKDSDKKVTGKTEAGTTVTVKAGSKVLGTAVAGKTGTFTVTLKTAQKAGTVLTVTAADKAKNVSAATTVKVVDKTAPTAPKVDKVTAKTTKVTGKAEAYSTVVVKVGNKVLGSKTADKNGKFSVSISKQSAGKVLSVTAKDKAGNVSKASKVTVKK
ncbi:bifunctional 2',3'-cyclic-nucleotide 2'-phosphodiesterase/3'-nucleotidase [Neobacillus soli]|uniref:bifunctional 2',3'-cyclic-nucleotide 2'-phosphodiesterase/3'-nucleotidase n=1 Tax=Neobacillus soli TaxID=220688 RepID=UPI000AE941DB|nr:bifunctional 2',3'-cyclic-nucleotide 2'-phosphodiesterase/3'-nucleotidase [Neobacillus soli]